MMGLCVLALIALPPIIGLLFHWQHANPHEGEFNWSIQGQDDALAGCPKRYKEWVDLPDGGAILIGCWGDGP
jgi:hypothetical protein